MTATRINVPLEDPGTVGDTEPRGGESLDAAREADLRGQVRRGEFALRVRVTAEGRRAQFGCGVGRREDRTRTSQLPGGEQ